MQEAFVLTSHSMGIEQGMNVLYLNGYGYHFDGDSFSRRQVMRKITEFKVQYQQSTS
jgi:hypothetical protein